VVAVLSGLVLAAGWLADRFAIGNDEAVDALQLPAAWMVVFSSLFAALSSATLSRVAMRQVGAINAAAHRIMGGDFSHRISRSRSGDEFDRLTDTLNQMLDRIEQLIAAIRNATDNIAHDLRTPLARHRAELEEALQHPPSAAELVPWVERQIAEVDHVLEIFNSLLRLATIESGVLRSSFKPLDFGVVVADAIAYYDAFAQDCGVTLRHADDGVHRVHGDRDLLFQAIANLLDNAIKFTPAGRAVVVEIDDSEARIELRITDGGAGLTPEMREKVFERLYRGETSRTTPGTGLGLAIVRAIARLHRGDCRLEPSTHGPGVCAVLTLPKQAS